MLYLAYHPDDRSTAARVMSAFSAHELPAEHSLGKTDVLIALISPTSNDDSENRVEAAIIRALDAGVPISAIIVQNALMPKLIDHLAYANWSAGDDVDAVQAILADVTAPEVKAQIRVRTPQVRRSNRQAGWVIGVAAIIMFALGLYAVGILGIQRPNEEFDAVDATVQAMVEQELAPQLATAERFLPASDDQRYFYPATALAFPTRLRPFVAATATGYAEQNSLYAPTPTPQG